MRIQKSELVQKLNKVRNVIPKRCSVAVLQSVLVQDGTFIATNIELTVKVKAEGSEGESFLIPERALEVINNLPDGEVEISATEGNSIVIQMGTIRNRYQTEAASSFPRIMEQEEGCDFTIQAETLLESLRRVAYAIPAKGTTPTIASMCLQADGKYLHFVGLDGRALAWDKAEFGGKFEMLIPKSTVEKLKTVGLTGEVQVRHNKASAVFATEELEIHTRLVEGNYFRYQEMFQTLPMHTAVVREELAAALARARICTEGRCPIRFELYGNTLKLSLKGSSAEYQEMLALRNEIPTPLTIGFDAGLLLETLKAFDCEDVAVSFGGAKTPMVVEDEDSNFKVMILPVVL